jgi:hypothetical protein
LSSPSRYRIIFLSFNSTQLSKTNNFLFVFSLLILSLLPVSHTNVCYAGFIILFL